MAGAAGLRALRSGLPELQNVLADALDRRVSELEENERVLESDDLKRLTSKDEEAAKDLDAVRERSRQRIAEARTFPTEYKAGLRELATDLDDLLGLFD